MNADAKFDVAVVGGGPAGSSAAITAARMGARVALLERGRYPRHKVCGEFISPESLALLRSLLADNPNALAALEQAPRIDRARVVARGRSFEAPISPAAASFARHDLDLLLWQAAERAGVITRQGADVKAHRGGREGDDAIEMTIAGEALAIRAAATVDARGRVADSISHSSPEKWIGLKAHFSAREISVTTDLHMVDGGYCGVQPVLCCGRLLVNVCALVRADKFRSLDQVFAADALLLSRSRDWTLAAGPVATGGISFHPPETGRGGVFLAGDAAGFIDPFVGDGIAIALRSGAMAGDIAAQLAGGLLTREAAHRLYAMQYRAAFDRPFRNARRLRRLLGAPAVARNALLAALRLPGAAGLIVKGTRSAGS